MCGRPKIPPPPTPIPVVAPPETVGDEGTVKMDFGINPATGKPEARRRGLRALRLPPFTSTTPQA